MSASTRTREDGLVETLPLPRAELRPLMRAFAQCELPYLTDESVEQYKNEKVEQAKRRFRTLASAVRHHERTVRFVQAMMGRDTRWGWATRAFMIVIMGLGICFLTSLAAGALALFGASVGASSPVAGWTLWQLGTAGLALAGATFVLMLAATGAGYALDWLATGVIGELSLSFMKAHFAAESIRCAKIEWREVPLESYEHTVPPELLEKAEELRSRRTDVTFVVEFTHETEYVRAPDVSYTPWPDPFLTAVLGEERIRIGVWDQADYIPEQRFQG